MIRPEFKKQAMHARMQFAAAIDAQVAETDFPFGQGRAAEGAHAHSLGATPVLFKRQAWLLSRAPSCVILKRGTIRIQGKRRMLHV